MSCLGDFVTELPVLHALQERIRSLEVEVSVDRASASLLADYALAGVHVREDWRSRLAPIASSLQRPFDLLLYLRSNPAIKLTRVFVNARRKLGTEGYDEAAAAQGVVRHRYSVLRQVLGEDLPAITTDVKLAPERSGEALIAAGAGRDARILCLGVGAGSPERRWPVERFAELARALRPQFDRIVALGSSAEAPLCDALAANAGAVSLAGQPLTRVAALLASASLHVGNDSGLSHLAAAQGCPAVSVGLADPYYTPWLGYGIPGRPADLSAAAVLAFLRESEMVPVRAGRSRPVYAGTSRNGR